MPSQLQSVNAISAAIYFELFTFYYCCICFISKSECVTKAVLGFLLYENCDYTVEISLLKNL